MCRTRSCVSCLAHRTGVESGVPSALAGGLCLLALPGGQCPPGPALSWGLSCGLLGWLLWGSAVACVLARALWGAVFIALHILPVAHSLFHRFGCFPHGPFSSLRTFCRSSSSVPPPYPARFPGCLPPQSFETVDRSRTPHTIPGCLPPQSFETADHLSHIPRVSRFVTVSPRSSSGHIYYRCTCLYTLRTWQRNTFVDTATDLSKCAQALKEFGISAIYVSAENPNLMVSIACEVCQNLTNLTVFYRGPTP